MVSLPASAVTLREAMNRFALPTVVAETERLTQERKTLPRRIRIRSEFVHGPKVRSRNEAARRALETERALEHNAAAKRQSLIDQLKKNALQGYARENSFAEWTAIRPDAWTDLEPDFHESTVKDRDGKIYAVRVDKAETAEEVPGLKVSDNRNCCLVAEPLQEGSGHYRSVEIAFEHGKVCISGINAFGEKRKFVLARHRGLFKALIDARLEDQEEGKPAADYKYISGKDFAPNSKTNTLMKTFNRARKDLAKCYREIFDQAVDPLQLIENKKGSGYRLAPNFRATRSSVSP